MTTATHSHAVSVFWTVWFAASAGAFLVVEFWMLASGRPQDTLSANVWRAEQFLPGQAIVSWSALHLLFTGVLIVLFAWLIGHFGWGLWR